MNLPRLEASPIYRLPEAFRCSHHTAWSQARGGGALHSFLEGPAFDRLGNLYCTDVCHGRIFRVDRQGNWTLFTDYDGQPNGLKIHRDGRIFVADAQHGVLVFDPDTGALASTMKGPVDSPFQGVNDLHFACDGTLLVTDPGHSCLAHPSGRIWMKRSDHEFAPLVENLPYPNGLALTPGQDALCFTTTRSLQVMRAQWKRPGVANLGVFAQLSGGLAGPDGMAFCEDGSFVVAHSGLGVVWLFDRLGEVRLRIQSTAGIRTTNVAFDPASREDLYITESETGSILKVSLPVNGASLFSHQ
jgi:gluconolactonase